MRREIRIDDENFQAFGYPTVAVLVRNPNVYYPWVVYDPDTTDENILDDILRRYSGAWEELADV